MPNPVGQLPDLRIALYQPDIPGNTGAIMRLAACFGVGLDVIGPVGFDMSDRALRRAGMDYPDMATLRRHDDWDAFETERKADIAVEYTAGRKMDINIGRLTMLGGTPARDPQLFDPAELISFFNDQKRKDLVVVMFHKNIWTDDEEKREIAKMNAYFRDRGYKRIVIQQFRSWGRPTLSDIRP